MSSVVPASGRGRLVAMASTGYAGSYWRITASTAAMSACNCRTLACEASSSPASAARRFTSPETTKSVMLR
jgi:hypothetical protein